MVAAELGTINDYDEDDGAATEFGKYKSDVRSMKKADSLTNLGIHMMQSYNEDADDRETGVHSDEEEDEVCISLLLKNDPNLSVRNICMSYHLIDYINAIYEEIF